MQNPGVKTFGPLSIAGAGEQFSEEIEDLDGLASLTLSLRFAWGSGGTTCRVYLQTRIGDIWRDIACRLFASAADHKEINLAANAAGAAWTTPTDGALPDDTVVQGVLGDALRLKVISTGIYGGSTLLDARAACR